MAPGNLPVFKCLPRAIGGGFKDGLKFWCPFCQKWHLHGRGPGHRTAHCIQGSALYQNGYIIKIMSKQELREIAKEITEYLKQPSKKEGS